jgi:hypothetical protein
VDKKEYCPFEVPNAKTRKKVSQSSMQGNSLNVKTARVKNSPCGNEIRIAPELLTNIFQFALVLLQLVRLYL